VPVPVTVDPAAVTPNDTRIMLHMLLSEARAYHEARAASLRRPTTPARPAVEIQGSFSSQATASFTSQGWCATPTRSPVQPAGECRKNSPCGTTLEDASPDGASPPCRGAEPMETDDAVDAEVKRAIGLPIAAFPTPENTTDPETCEDCSTADNAVEYDGWADLQSQIEALWYDPTSNEPPAQRYLRLKTYLTWLFLWDAGRDWDDFGEVSAAASAEWIQTRQKARIDALPPGRLFA